MPAALITVHGMGDMPADYAAPLFRTMRERLGSGAAQLDCRAVYYQDLLKENERTVWELSNQNAPLHYAQLRKFLLFGFGDAAGLENRKEEPGSVYELAQGRIARQLLAACHACRDRGGAVPVVFLAHSLGCQVLSSYIYDAQKAAAGGRVSVGIWKDIDAWSKGADGPGRALDDAEKQFLRAGTCMAWITTGCNIPIFVAAHKRMDIKAIAAPNGDPATFRWINLYDPDDPLGWPLAPLSHTAYWDDDDVLDPLAKLLGQLLG